MAFRNISQDKAFFLFNFAKVDAVDGAGVDDRRLAAAGGEGLMLVDVPQGDIVQTFVGDNAARQRLIRLRILQSPHEQAV